MNEREAVDAAMATLQRNDDDSVDEKSLIDAVADLIDLDEAAERRHRATLAVKKRRRPGATDPVGQLALPGLLPYGYEPCRLIADNEGHIVEQAKARPEYKRAEAERARIAARRQQVWADRKTQESEAYAAWAIEQFRRRRRAADVVFDVFVRETGIWQDAAADVEPGPGDDVEAATA